MDTPAPAFTSPAPASASPTRADAFASAFLAFTAWARRVLPRFLPWGHGNHVSVDDVLQDVFLAWVADGRTHAHDPEALQTLLRGIAVHKALDARRAALTARRYFTDPVDTDDRPSHDDPERAVTAREFLARLSPDDRALVLAHAVDERAFTELAASNPAKPWTLRRRYDAAIDALTREIDDLNGTVGASAAPPRRGAPSTCNRHGRSRGWSRLHPAARGRRAGLHVERTKSTSPVSRTPPLTRWRR